MRIRRAKWIFKLALIAAIWPSVMAQTTGDHAAKEKLHVILLDVSGSMKDRYRNNLRQWLIEPLVKSGGFNPGDRLLVRWFAHEGRESFAPDDPNRRYQGVFDINKALQHVPTADQANGTSTDLPEAIGLTLADLQKFGNQENVLIWMVTDNVQTAGGHGSADPLYQRISQNPHFRAAYLFPLLRENGQAVTDKTAMVMYLLHHSASGNLTSHDNPGLDRLADEVGAKIGNRPVTWFPFEGRISLDEDSVTAGGANGRFTDNRLELPDVAEGALPQFNLEFRFRSQLRGREIVAGQIAAPTFSIDSIPQSLSLNGELKNWPAFVDPPKLTMKSEQSTSSQYRATLTAENLTFGHGSFWEAVWRDRSDPVVGLLSFKLTNVQTKVDQALLAPVRDLDRLRNYLNMVELQMRQSENSGRAVMIPVTFRVRYNTFWPRLAAVMLCLLILGLVAGGLSLFLIKRRYELMGPDGRKIISLGMLGQRVLMLHGKRVAAIKRRFDKLTVAPLGKFSLDGTSRARKLNERDHFVLEDRVEKIRHDYEFRRLMPPGRKSATKKNILDT